MNFKKFSAGLLIALMSGSLSAGVAFADEVFNNVDNTVDATVEVLNLTVGQSGNVTLKVSPANSDGENGCNLDSGESLVAAINNSASSFASITSASSVTFAGPGCGDTQVVSVTALAVGETTISLTQTSNTAGSSFNLAPATFKVVVSAAPVVIVDTTAPVLTLPANMTVEASSAAGKAVVYVVSATDETSPANPAVICNPASGSIFALGSTVVNCSATDTAGNVGNGSFTVTVVDTTGPATPSPVSPADDTYVQTANQTLIDWSDVTDFGNVSEPITYVYQASNSIDVTGTGEFVAPVYTSVPALTSSFIPTPGTPEGVYYWHVKALDTLGNASAWSTIRKITVDNTAPVVVVPANIVTEATSPAGAVVIYAATATDINPTSPTVSCNSLSGTIFPMGTSTLTCTATDTAGNQSSPLTFDVTVQDTTAPTDGSISINSGAVYTNLLGASLALGANDLVGVTGYRIADGVDASAASTVAITSTTAFTLPVAWTLPAGDGSKTVAVQYRDAAGNWSANVTDDITVDMTAPGITISAPTATAYALNQVVLADYACTDALSGVATCIGTVADNAALDTSVSGAKTFTVTSTDNAGNVSTPQTVSYSVGYNPATFVAGAPVTLTSKEFKSKSTIPVKFTIKDFLGNPYGLATATLQVCKVGGECFTPVSSASSNIGDAFRYDAAAGQYIYNLSTKSGFAGAGQYTLKITIDGNLQTPSSTITIK